MDKPDKSIMGGLVSGGEISISQPVYIVGREGKGRKDLTFPKDELLMSTKQFQLIKTKEGYFAQCCSRQFPTKIVLADAPFLLQEGMVIELGSAINSEIAIEVFAIGGDPKVRISMDYYRINRLGEYSNKVDYYTKDKFVSKVTGQSKRRNSQQYPDRPAPYIVRTKWLDDSSDLPPFIVMKVIKGHNYFINKCLKGGKFINSNGELFFCIGATKDCRYETQCDNLTQRNLEIRFDERAGWLAVFSHSNDFEVGAYVLLKNRQQLASGGPSDPIKLYKEMVLSVGNHQFRVIEVDEERR